MSRDQTWGDHALVVAVAQAFRRPVRIIQSIAHNHSYVQEIETVAGAGAAVPHIELCHWAERHYGSVLPANSVHAQVHRAPVPAAAAMPFSAEPRLFDSYFP